MKLELDKIRLDGGTQPRAELLIEVMEDYAEQMRSGVEFPPIIVFFDGKDYWLADGFHRVGAALRVNPAGTIEAEVHQGSQSDAQWYSFGVNQTHGLRRTREDRTRAIEAALRHPKAVQVSDRELADHVGVSPSTISKYRKDLKSGVQIGHLPKRVGRDGKTYPARQPIDKSDNRRSGRKVARKSSRRTRLQIHKPVRAPSLMEKMTAVTLPHNPVMGAMTLIEVFDVVYLRVLVEELSKHLKGLEA